MHGMMFDRTKNCWIRSKSFEHKQFLDPRDALSSDDDPFREISDLTVERSVRIRVTHPSGELGATTVVHHDLGGPESSFADVGQDTEHEESGNVNPKLPG